MSTRLNTVAVALILLAIPLLAGCMGSDPGSAGPGKTPGTNDQSPPITAVGGVGETIEIGMTDLLKFDPASIVVKKGTTIRWTNTGDSQSHDVTHDGATPAFKSYDQDYDAGNLKPGATFEHVFTETGEFPYYCKWHGKRSMAATLTVVE